jgi:hypothetical protein
MGLYRKKQVRVPHRNGEQVDRPIDAVESGFEFRVAKRNSKRREWTKTDVRELKTLAREKTPARKIARTLKRTEGATRQKAFNLGVSLDSRM